VTGTATERWIRRLVTAACFLCLLGLASMVWSVLDPRPIPVMFAMSVGQGLGIASFLAYLAAILLDLRRRRVLGDHPEAGPAEPR
jgi:MFS family permease